MSLDLFVDEPNTPAPPAPAAVSEKPRSNSSGWLPMVLGTNMALIILACVIWIPKGDSTPDDGDDIKPPAVSGLHVLVVEETADRDDLPASQVAIFTSIPLREWYATNCAKEGGEVAYRCFDQHDKLTNETQIWRELREKVTLDPPAYLLVNGKKAVQGKLPADPASFQKTLEEFKGK